MIEYQQDIQHLSKPQRFVLVVKVLLWIIILPIFALVAGLIKIWPFNTLINYQMRTYGGYYPKSTFLVATIVYFILSVPVYFLLKYLILKKVK